MWNIIKCRPNLNIRRFLVQKSKECKCMNRQAADNGIMFSFHGVSTRSLGKVSINPLQFSILKLNDMTDYGILLTSSAVLAVGYNYEYYRLNTARTLLCSKMLCRSIVTFNLRL